MTGLFVPSWKESTIKTRIIIAVVAAVLACAVMVPAAEAKRPAGHDRGHHYGHANKRPAGYWYTAQDGGMFWIWTVQPKPTKPTTTVDGHGLGKRPRPTGGSYILLP